MAEACMTRSSVFSIQGTGWLSWQRAIAAMEVDTKTESWDDLSQLVIVSHSQRSISQSSMKDVIVFADLRALYEENNLIVRQGTAL